MAQKRAVMTFNAELMADYTHVATVTRYDGAVTISVTAQADSDAIISEVNVTISSTVARELTKKLIHRLTEMDLW